MSGPLILQRLMKYKGKSPNSVKAFSATKKEIIVLADYLDKRLYSTEDLKILTEEMPHETRLVIAGYFERASIGEAFLYEHFWEDLVNSFPRSAEFIKR